MGKNPNIFDSAFNTYRVNRVLGEGGAGRVYAVSDNDGTELALKCLFPELVNTERQKRFKNEIVFCEKQHHRNIVQILDTGFVILDKIKSPFYVMPRFQDTLRTLIDKNLSHQEILPLFSQILDGVEAAHLCNVWHRDLKPENALHDSENKTLVIADFGIAHFEEEMLATEVKTKPTSRMANIRYSAPEQRKKSVKVDHRADIYALGLILNEMFTRDVPQGTGYKTIKSVSAAFAYLDEIVNWMIQQEPDERPSSIDEIKKILIARKNQFVALQELDKTRNEVVPMYEPGQVAPIELISADYQNGKLLLNLSRNPDTGIIQWFNNPEGGFSYSTNCCPSDFSFSGNRALISIHNENFVQNFINYFKQYLKIARDYYQAFLHEQARKKEQEMRKQLEHEIAEKERRERILKNIKI